MTLQSSGTISISQINTEVSSVNSHSLRALSAAASKSTPDGVNEFYGYSHANPIPTSLSTRQLGSGLCCYQYRSVTAAIAICNVHLYMRLRNDGTNLIWEVKGENSQGGSYWNASGTAYTLSTSYITLGTWTGATAGMVDWSGSTSGGGVGNGSVSGNTTNTGATYAAADTTWQTLSTGQSMGWKMTQLNLQECFQSSTRYYTTTLHNIYGRRSGYDDTSIGAFQARCDATATSNNCF